MLQLIPERLRTAKMARAMTSPASIIATGAAAAIAIASGLPLIVAPVVGAAVYVARIGFALPRPVPGEHIEPSALKEPWRSFVRDAMEAKNRFDRTLRRTPEGPLKDRLGELNDRIGVGVRECWNVARHGDTLDVAQQEMQAREIEAQLVGVRRDMERGGDSAREVLGRTEAALVAQLDSYTRLRSVAADAQNRLRLLNAQLDEAVARAIELSVRRSDSSELVSVTNDVDSVVNEMESLRQALASSELPTGH